MKTSRRGTHPGPTSTPIIRAPSISAKRGRFTPESGSASAPYKLGGSVPRGINPETKAATSFRGPAPPPAEVRRRDRDGRPQGQARHPDRSAVRGHLAGPAATSSPRRGSMRLGSERSTAYAKSTVQGLASQSHGSRYKLVCYVCGSCRAAV